MLRDPYAFLRVPYDIDEEALKKRYRELAKLHHPDSGGDDRNFILILEAYDLIKYNLDHGIKAGAQKSQTGSDEPRTTSNKPADNWHYNRPGKEAPKSDASSTRASQHTQAKPRQTKNAQPGSVRQFVGRYGFMTLIVVGGALVRAAAGHPTSSSSTWKPAAKPLDLSMPVESAAPKQAPFKHSAAATPAQVAPPEFSVRELKAGWDFNHRIRASSVPVSFRLTDNHVYHLDADPGFIPVVTVVAGSIAKGRTADGSPNCGWEDVGTGQVTAGLWSIRACAPGTVATFSQITVQ